MSWLKKYRKEFKIGFTAGVIVGIITMTYILLK